MKTRALAIITLSLMLSGCRHGRPDEEDEESAKMRSWLGHDIHDAISAFGPPSGIVPNGPTSLYEWRYTGASRALVVGGRSVTTGTAWTDSCREWFDVNYNEMIVGWHWKGRC